MAKLFRFTESVIFSFDGDAAGRRAAGRALEAALPHASDLRSVRFLFLPAEHDPDSFIREQGPEAFEREVAQAVPLSTQLIAQAGADCDLATPEGRSRMLTQAGPLVALLPDGLLREQLVQALAKLGGIAVEVLQAHWAKRGKPRAGPDAAGSAHASDRGDRADDDDPRAYQDRDSSGWRNNRQPHGRLRLHPMGGRRLPPQAATLLDRTAWLLARHAAVWLDLPGESHDFLIAQPAPYNQFFAGLERVLHEHGAVTMAALLDELRGSQTGAADDDELDQAKLRELLDRLAGYHEVEDEESPALLVEAVLRRLHQRAVADELQWLIESGELSEAATERRNALFALTAELKKNLSAPSTHGR
jgi:DNA primase